MTRPMESADRSVAREVETYAHEVSPEIRRRAAFPGALVAGALALLLLPVAWPCPLRVVAGVPCPTCGMTRAARLALTGDLSGATHMHPLWWIVLPAIAILGGVEMFGYVRTGKMGLVSQRAWFKWFARVVIAAVVAVWVARFFGAFGGPVPV